MAQSDGFERITVLGIGQMGLVSAAVLASGDSREEHPGPTLRESGGTATSRPGCSGNRVAVIAWRGSCCPSRSA